MISFGSVIAGLCTASGVGLLVLLRGRHRFRTFAIILGTTYVAAALAGLLLQLF